MTLQERITQTKKWFTDLEAVEKDMEKIREWRDMAFDMNDFMEYHKAVTRLLYLEKRSIFMRCCLANYWFNKEDEKRCREIEKYLNAKGVDLLWKI